MVARPTAGVICSVDGTMMEGVGIKWLNVAKSVKILT